MNEWEDDLMKVIIPAAGVGTRLRPHTHTIPKALLHVAGKPILAYILDSVARLSPEEVIIVTGFLGDKIQEYVSKHYDLNVRYVEQEKLMGLGHAVYTALNGIDGGPTLIMLGDTIVETDIEAFVSSGENVLGLTPVDDPQRFGIAEVEHGRVIELVEKPAEPKSNLAIIGLYYLSDGAVLKEHIDRLITGNRRTKGEYQLTDALQSMIDAGVGFDAFSVDGWFDCGKKETLIATNRHLLENLPQPAPIEGSVIIPPTFVAPTALIESSIIGPYVSVSDKAIIKKSIIQNSIIDYGARVESALLNDSLIGHKAIVSGDFRALNVGDSSEIEHF